MFGSSSGSAVAVAANLAMAALGTETDGSLVGPSSVCSVVALKPAFNAVSNDGVIPLAKSMDTVGAITRCAKDNLVISSSIMGTELSLQSNFSVSS
ncbi:hypothetical protein DSO57_1015924 [Entomophthora muscae]|uniref:Uncharacterized protein n=2 Tax=Entomophthora muscae TaxID=34485 RepID=A0ACC2TTJ7_9FUNG|nr:hypothetical protein DSO57_1031685 [Entomophthora muscae]KAJ9077522.1 hypothetical protein DSO57_1015924 [Entomophthora muscae]